MKQEQARGEWYLIDVDGKVLGRVASRIARILIGKHRPTYTPHVDSGDHIVVVNAAGIRVTGNKTEEKLYYRHSTIPGHLKAHAYRDVLARFPTRPLELAVKRMLPKNRLQARRIRRLHIYTGAEHPHKAQNPRQITING
jgi:large subunit ribosomal protein L13